MNLTKLRKNQQGIAALEFALLAPLLLFMLLGGVEVTRFILLNQKAEKLANTISDVVAQSQQASISGLDELLAATTDIMEPFDFSAEGLVIISSVYRAPGEDDASVNWQYEGGGTLEEQVSRIGEVDDVAELPDGFTLNERENVIATEVFYTYTPLFLDETMEITTIYKMSFYKPRFGALTQDPS